VDLKEKLNELLLKEESGEELEELDFEFDLDEEILTCGNKVNKLEGLVNGLAGDASEVPERIAGLMNHVSGRLSFHLRTLGKGTERNSLKKLAISVTKLSEALSERVEKAREILKSIPSFSEIDSLRSRPTPSGCGPGEVAAVSPGTSGQARVEVGSANRPGESQGGGETTGSGPCVEREDVVEIVSLREEIARIEDAMSRVKLRLRRPPGSEGTGGAPSGTLAGNRGSGDVREGPLLGG